jgi:hypothetical protein
LKHLQKKMVNFFKNLKHIIKIICKKYQNKRTLSRIKLFNKSIIAYLEFIYYKFLVIF